jgi:hypothetical protein
MKPNVKSKKVLQLKKQKVAMLSPNEISQIIGGAAEAAASTYHRFTCRWCTSDGTISSSGPIPDTNDTIQL